MKKEVINPHICRLYYILLISLIGCVLLSGVVYSDGFSVDSELPEQDQQVMEVVNRLNNEPGLRDGDAELVNHNWERLTPDTRDRVIRNPDLANSIEERHVIDFINKPPMSLEQLYNNEHYRQTFERFFEKPSQDPEEYDYRRKFFQALTPKGPNTNFGDNLIGAGRFEFRGKHGTEPFIIKPDGQTIHLGQIQDSVNIDINYDPNDPSSSFFSINSKEGTPISGNYRGSISSIEIGENGELIVRGNEGKILTPIDVEDDLTEDDLTEGDQNGDVVVPDTAVTIAPYTATANRFPNNFGFEQQQGSNEIPSIIFNDRNTEIYFPRDTQYDITVRDNTYSAYPSQNAELSQEYLDLITQNAQNGDFTNVDMARLWLQSRNGNQEVLNKLNRVSEQYTAEIRLFNDEVLEQIGDIALEQVYNEQQNNEFNTLDSILENLGNNLQEKLEGIKSNIIPELNEQEIRNIGEGYISALAKNYDEEQIGRLKQEINDELALLGLNSITSTPANDPGFRTYSNVMIDSITNSYKASNPMSITNEKML
jgi:hypothetical protein